MSEFELESEEIEAEELEKQEPTKEPTNTKPIRVHAFDAREKRVRGIVTFPENLHTKLVDEAFKRKMSRASIVREALSEHFAETESSEVSEDDEKIFTLLEQCRGFFGGFNISDEDEGFIDRIKKADLTGEVWTEKLLKIFAQHFEIGYKGYWSPPNRDELLNVCMDAMKLDEDQREFLTKEVSGLFEPTEEKENTSEQA